MAKTAKEMFKEVIDEAFNCMQAVDDPVQRGNLAANIALALANSGAISVEVTDNKDNGTKENARKTVSKKTKTEPKNVESEDKVAEEESGTTVMKNARTVREQVNDDQVWTDKKKEELKEEIEFLTALQEDEENHEALKTCAAQLTSGIYEDFTYDMPPATVKELYNYIQQVIAG